MIDVRSALTCTVAARASQGAEGAAAVAEMACFSASVISANVRAVAVGGMNSGS